MLNFSACYEFVQGYYLIDPTPGLLLGASRRSNSKPSIVSHPDKDGDLAQRCLNVGPALRLSLSPTTRVAGVSIQSTRVVNQMLV